MRELVLDRRAFPQGGASRRRLELLAQALLQHLVFGNRDGVAMAEFSGGVLTAPRAVIADIRIELTVVPTVIGCTWPLGHAIVRSRRFSVNADFGNRRPLCDFHGLQTILHRSAPHRRACC